MFLKVAQEAVNQRGSSLLAFAGGIPGSIKRGSDKRAAVFDVVGTSNIDGAILLAGTMVNELGTEALEKLLERLDGVPLCAIGIEVPGVPSILVDNQAGINQAMTHLVEHHKASKVAFIRGPNKNKEAESRFAAYKASLAQANIAFDERLVFQGDFLQSSGKHAVAHWLSEQVKPDAIIGANDAMALGALHQLNKNGMSVPGDVALIGFDDLPVAQNATPPLTTVRQPLRDLAVAAVRTIMDQITGREVPRLQVMQTHLVVRESCGCALRLSSTGQSLNPPDSSRGTQQSVAFPAAFAAGQPALKAELQRSARGEFQVLGSWEEKLIAAFSDQVTGGKSEFVERLEKYVGAVAAAGGDVRRFHDVVTAFRRIAVPCCGNDWDLRGVAEDLLQAARLTVANAVEREQARDRIALEHSSHTLVSVGAQLAGSFDLAELQQVVSQRLHELGVTACYVSVYEPFTLERAGKPEKARTVAVFDAEVELHPIATPFDSHQLAPPELWPPARLHRFVTLPLFWKELELGIALVECDASSGAVLEAVREQLSIGLYGALLAADG